MGGRTSPLPAQVRCGRVGKDLAVELKGAGSNPETILKTSVDRMAGSSGRYGRLRPVAVEPATGRGASGTAAGAPVHGEAG